MRGSLRGAGECTIWYMEVQIDQGVAGKQRLLDAVIEHFSAEGLADQSLRRIAEAVGSSHRMLLYHFGSKDGLLLNVAQAVEARTQQQLADAGIVAGERTDEVVR